MTTSTTKPSRRGHRLSVPAVLVIAGGALAVATWIGDQPGLAVGLAVFYALAATAAYLWAGRDGDTAAIMRGSGDERQQRLDRDAMAIAGLAMVTVAIIGAVVSAAVNNGDIGPFGLLAAVGGGAYAIAVAWLHRRS